MAPDFPGAHGPFLVTGLISRFVGTDPPGSGFTVAGVWMKIFVKDCVRRIFRKNSTPKFRAANHLFIFY